MTDNTTLLLSAGDTETERRIHTQVLTRDVFGNVETIESRMGHVAWYADREPYDEDGTAIFTVWCYAWQVENATTAMPTATITVNDHHCVIDNAKDYGWFEVSALADKIAQEWRMHA